MMKKRGSMYKLDELLSIATFKDSKIQTIVNTAKHSASEHTSETYTMGGQDDPPAQ
jgi:hypothetical protein